MNHKKLEVYELSMMLVEGVYRLTRDYPSDERFGLVSQMRRAAVSIPSNLAEGCGRSSDAEMARFFNIAYGSCQELVVQLEIARRLEYQVESTKVIEEGADRVGKALYGLWKNRVERNDSTGTRTPDTGHR